MPEKRHLKVGLVGAGLGGLAAAIAIARAGCDVTVLEAAAELGEIGAGIQMTPNVSRLLIRWGVADIIGDDLVQCKEINMRSKDGRVIQRTELYPKVVREFGFPWWMVHRHHLHQGLSEGARRHGAKLVTGARVSKIDYADGKEVHVETEKGERYTFDFLVGSDGLKSVVRRILFPNVKPRAPTNNAAYRAVLPFSEVYEKVPEAKELFGNAIDVWNVEHGYVITYPISAGREWNTVLSHHRPEPVTDVEEDVNMDELRDHFKDIDPRLKKVIDLIPSSKRWPLLVTGPLGSWSNSQKNVVLMGDAAHSMVNHLAQGAATSMEDGAYLGRVLAEVERGVLSLSEAVDVYEKGRMPRAWIKQQTSFTMGAVYMATDPEIIEARDKASAASVASTSKEAEVHNLQEKPRVTGPDANAMSWNLWGAPETMQSIFGYDPEGDADFHVLQHLQQRGEWNRVTGLSEALESKWTKWWMPPNKFGQIWKQRPSKL